MEEGICGQGFEEIQGRSKLFTWSQNKVTSDHEVCMEAIQGRS